MHLGIMLLPVSVGEPAKTIDQIPLDWCYGDGIVIDMKHKEDFFAITAQDIQNYLSEKGLSLKSGIIVLIKTGRDQHMGTKKFFTHGTGMSAEATEWLID